MTLLRRLPVFPLYYNGETKFMPIHCSDLTEIIYNVIEKNIYSKIIECVGPDVISFKEILKILTKLIGVTILTSLDNRSLKQIGYSKSLQNIVKHQAKLASEANLDAVVCSSHEVKDVKKIFKKEIITPGIRFENDFNDQKRVVTPKKAFLNGSDWIVIGRPITKGNIKKNIQKLIDHLN